MSKSTIRVVHEGSFSSFDDCTQEVNAIVKAASENEATVQAVKLRLDSEQQMHWSAYDVHYTDKKVWKYKVVTHRNA